MYQRKNIILKRKDLKALKKSGLSWCSWKSWEKIETKSFSNLDRGACLNAMHDNKTKITLSIVESVEERDEKKKNKKKIRENHKI